MSVARELREGQDAPSFVMPLTGVLDNGVWTVDGVSVLVGISGYCLLGMLLLRVPGGLWGELR